MTGGRYEISECTEKDVDLLYEMERLCFVLDAWSREAFAESLKSDSCTVYKVDDLQMQKTVAYSVIYCAADQADLANIAVLPTCRGRGIAKMLLSKTLEKACNLGVLEVFLEVRESNEAAKKLYLSSGFVEIGKRKNYYSRPRENAILMMCKL